MTTSLRVLFAVTVFLLGSVARAAAVGDRYEQVLRDHGVAAAQSMTWMHGTQRFLEVQRFDRLGARGRRARVDIRGQLGYRPVGWNYRQRLNAIASSL